MPAPQQGASWPSHAASESPGLPRSGPDATPAQQAPGAPYSMQALRREIVGIDRQVPLLDGSMRVYANLDNAASTPAFRYVRDKIDEALEWYSSVHRGSGFKSLLSTHAYDQAREIVGQFVEADPQADCVIFGKNTTEAINKLAARTCWEPDDVVVTTAMEHHSNDLPWRPRAHVEHVGLLPDSSLDMEAMAATLRRHEGHVRLVAVTGASNVSGFMPPIYDIAELAHRHGARVLVDCAQLAPHRAIHKGRAGTPRYLDFIAISGHKMYAPFGTGALIGPRAAFCDTPPDVRGGGTIEVVTLDEVYWADPPERDEAGSPNVLGAVALAASIRCLMAVGMENVARHEAELTGYTLARLNRLPGVTVFGSKDPQRTDDRLGVITFKLRDLPHGQVAAILGFEGGIGVRNGCFCAHPYVLHLLGMSQAEFEVFKAEALQHDRSALPGMVRASFGCYNTVEEVDRLVEMLERILAGDYRGEYEVERSSGSYYPRGFDPARLREWFTV